VSAVVSAILEEAELRESRVDIFVGLDTGSAILFDGVLSPKNASQLAAANAAPKMNRRFVISRLR
jgi:hypothetical protein